MSQVAEYEVCQEKHKSYVKLEKALENCKTEYHAAVSEHRHQCQLEVQAHALQLSQASETERQQSELVYQHACSQANKANARLQMITNSENDAMLQLQDAETHLAELTNELTQAQEESRNQQLQLIQTQTQADASLQLKDRQLTFQQQVAEQEVRQLESSHQKAIADTKAQASHALQLQEREKNQLQQQLADAIEIQRQERELNTERWKHFEQAREQDMKLMENRQENL